MNRKSKGTIDRQAPLTPPERGVRPGGKGDPSKPVGSGELETRGGQANAHRPLLNLYALYLQLIN
jgi:hypothetical protein